MPHAIASLTHRLQDCRDTHPTSIVTPQCGVWGRMISLSTLLSAAIAVSVLARPSSVSAVWYNDLATCEFLRDNGWNNLPNDLLHPERRLYPDTVNSSGGQIGGNSNVVVAPDWILHSNHTLNPPSGVDFFFDIDGTMYRSPAGAANRAFYDGGYAFRLYRLENMDGTPADLDYMPLASAGDIEIGAHATFGGYAPSNCDAPSLLRFGRSRVVSDAVGYGLGGLDPLEYHARGNYGDSGGGLAVADVWGWRLAGILNTAIVAESVAAPGVASWISAVTGIDHTLYDRLPLPASDRDWSGASGDSWLGDHWNGASVPDSSHKVFIGPRRGPFGASGPQVFGGENAEAHSLFLNTQMHVQGGSLELSDALFVGAEKRDSGNFFLVDGNVQSSRQIVGAYGAGTFSQTGGSNTIDDVLYIGHGDRVGGSQATGHYLMTQNAQSLTAERVIVGRFAGAAGVLEQSAGSITAEQLVVGRSGTGTYQISGGASYLNQLAVGESALGTVTMSAGSITASDVQVGAVATVTQTGGMFAVENSLAVDPASSYDLQGGELLFNNGTFASGTIDLALGAGNGQASMRFEGLTHINNGNLIGSSDGTFEVTANSLVVVPPGVEFTERFAHYANHGHGLHELGTTFHLGSGQLLIGAGDFVDNVAVGVGGEIRATDGRRLNFLSGMTLAAASIADLGVEDGVAGELTVKVPSRLDGSLIGKLTVDPLGEIQIAAPQTLNVFTIEDGASAIMEPGASGTHSLGMIVNGDLEFLVRRADTPVGAAALHTDVFVARSPARLALSADADEWSFEGFVTTYRLIDATFPFVASEFDELPQNGELGYGLFVQDVRVGSTFIEVDMLQALPGDLNGDGCVTTTEEALVTEGFGEGTDWATGDFNADGVTDQIDLVLTQANVGTCAMQSNQLQSVPEPNCFCWPLFMLALVARFRAKSFQVAHA